jgi:hypothetical protein
MRRLSLGAIVALACALASCGGGGGGVQPGTGAGSQANASGNGTEIESTIVVPGAAVTQSDTRRAQYVSPSATGLKIIVTDIPPTGGTASFTPTTTVYTLVTGVNQIVVPTPASAPGHAEDLTYTAYNQAPLNNAIPSTAKAVAWGLVTGFVVAPGLNTNNVVLAGVVDHFSIAAQSGSFGIMGPTALEGAQTTLGFGGATPAAGVATLYDVGGNNIATADGGPWPVIGALPTTATASSPGVPVTIVETPGSCGATGTAPHLKLSFAGGVPATSASISTTNGSLIADYDGDGGAGWYAVVTAKGQTSNVAYTLSSFGVTSTSTDFNCTTQTLSFIQSDENDLMTIAQHTAATPYTITEPNTTNCTNVIHVYDGNSHSTGLITPGTPTVLTGSTFTIQLISYPSAGQCNIEIEDANAVAGASGGAGYPGGTTYVSALVPSTSQLINVP